MRLLVDEMPNFCDECLFWDMCGKVCGLAPDGECRFVTSGDEYGTCPYLKESENKEV